MFIKYQTVRNSLFGGILATAAAFGAYFGFTDEPDAVPSRVAHQPVVPQKRNSVNQDPKAQDTANANLNSNSNTRLSNSQTGFAPSTNQSTRPNQSATPHPAGQSGWNQEPGFPKDKRSRYIAAMKFAQNRADSSGKGKDVLGPKSPWKLNLYDDNRDGQYDRAKLDIDRNEVDDEKWNFKNGRWEKSDGQLVWSNNAWISPAKVAAKTNSLKPADRLRARYQAAMKVALGRADSSGKGKDVLGSSSPWKLNLYDDDRNGTWDRAKLDTNRDEVEDEKWNFKDGRWEKKGGALVWSGSNWITPQALTKANRAAAQQRANDPKTATNEILGRYRSAFKVINAGSAGSSMFKDVFGASSPWKLNLYDDDRNGTWDRAKLDKNRDDIDDEKWNFKNGRWEKEGGAKIWVNNNWIKPSSIAQQNQTGNAPVSRELSLYRSAFQIISRGSNRSPKGKDVLGGASPWKLNIYDDDKNGTWDRAKLDKNRDEKDDEKWNFKDGRWEKDGGAKTWNGSQWVDD